MTSTYNHNTFSTIGASIPHVELTKEEKDVVKLAINGTTSGASPLINPVGNGIYTGYTLSNSLLSVVDELDDLTGVPPVGNGVDYSILKSSLQTIKSTLRDNGITGNFEEHTNRQSGRSLRGDPGTDNWGELLGIVGLHGVASGYNGVLEAIKDEGAPVVDNYSPLFSGILSGGPILDDLIETVYGVSSDIDPIRNPDGVQGAQDVVDEVAKGVTFAHQSLVSHMNADNANLRVALNTLSRFGLGMSVMSMDRDIYFGKRVLDEVAGPELRKELDDISQL